MKPAEQATILAKAVFLSLADKDKQKANKVVDNFIVYLKEHKLTPLLPKIIVAVKNLYYQATDTVGVKVTAKDGLSTDVLDKLTATMKKRLAKEIDLTNRVDEDIIGGVILRYDDKMIDASIKTKINKLAKQLEN
ncbi:ATP synthase F1 subunit delta [bacterium]|jgi:F-type H+-transporting ATPase subunit delta|nr:ATP synthase F1 subunit delta [bacterium]MBT4648775.1 ATP synthase F1 subunit delta [bacterium]